MGSAHEDVYVYDNISLSYSYNEKISRYILQRKSKHTFDVQ
jgi:hypothetical protein